MYWLSVIICQIETSLNFKQQVKNGSIASGIIFFSQYSVQQSKTKQIRKKPHSLYSHKIWFLPLVLFYFHFKHVLTKLLYSMIVSIQLKVEGFFFQSFNNLHIKALLYNLWNDCVQKNNNFSLIVLLSCNPQCLPITAGLPNSVPSCRNSVTGNGRVVVKAPPVRLKAPLLIVS